MELEKHYSRHVSPRHCLAVDSLKKPAQKNGPFTTKGRIMTYGYPALQQPPIQCVAKIAATVALKVVSKGQPQGLAVAGSVRMKDPYLMVGRAIYDRRHGGP